MIINCKYFIDISNQSPNIASTKEIKIMNKQDKKDFIMCKIVDYKVDILDHDDMSDVIEDALNVLDKETAISFRNWCLDKQQPYVRNGYQGMSTEKLWDEYSKRP